MEEPQNI